MVSQRTVLIVSAIAAAFVVVVLGLLITVPSREAAWMFDCNEVAVQAAFNHATAIGNYVIQLLW